MMKKDQNVVAINDRSGVHEINDLADLVDAIACQQIRSMGFLTEEEKVQATA